MKKITVFRKGAGWVSLLIWAGLLSCGCSSGGPSEQTASASSPSDMMAKSPVADNKAMDGVTRAESAAPQANGAAMKVASYGRASNQTVAHPVSIPSRKVIRRADLDIRVDNVEKAEKRVSEIVQGAGGYTETASSTDLASDHPTMNLSLRVPAERFDETISRFETLGVRLAKKISSEDVTSRIVDLDAQLKTLTAQEEVYRNMLRGRTELNEVFNIQSQLTTVRTQIEEITSQRKSQAGLAALSTVSLTLEQNAKLSAAPTDPNWMTQSWAGAMTGASSALRVVSVALMWLVAFSPFWIVALLILRRLTKGVWIRGPHSRTIEEI